MATRPLLSGEASLSIVVIRNYCGWRPITMRNHAEHRTEALGPRTSILVLMPLICGVQLRPAKAGSSISPDNWPSAPGTAPGLRNVLFRKPVYAAISRETTDGHNIGTFKRHL